MGAAMYAASEAEGPPQGTAAGAEALGGGDDDVVDAEIVDEENPNDGENK